MTSPGDDCPACREALKGAELVACPTCRTVHHSRCWTARAGCGVAGCASAPVSAAPPAAARRRIQPLLALALVAVLVSSAAVAFALLGDPSPGRRAVTTPAATPSADAPSRALVDATAVPDEPTATAAAPTPTPTPRPSAIRFHTGTDPGKPLPATFCRLTASSGVYCWTPNDGYTIVMDGGYPRRVRADEATNDGRAPSSYGALSSGGRRSAGAYSCESLESGLRCSGPGGHGWTLPRYVGLPEIF